jgi:hypothetical protein
MLGALMRIDGFFLGIFGMMSSKVHCPVSFPINKIFLSAVACDLFGS